MQLRRNVTLVKRALGLDCGPASRIQTVLSSIDVNQLVLMNRLRNVPSGARRAVMKAHGLVAESHIDHGLLVMESAASKMIQLFAL